MISRIRFAECGNPRATKTASLTDAVLPTAAVSASNLSHPRGRRIGVSSSLDAGAIPRALRKPTPQTSLRRCSPYPYWATTESKASAAGRCGRSAARHFRPDRACDRSPGGRQHRSGDAAALPNGVENQNGALLNDELTPEPLLLRSAGECGQLGFLRRRTQRLNHHTPLAAALDHLRQGDDTILRTVFAEDTDSDPTFRVKHAKNVASARKSSTSSGYRL